MRRAAAARSGGERPRLAGLGGNDRLNGGTGNDRLLGGSGDDTIDGFDGFDGDDRRFGGPGDDRISESRFADTIHSEFNGVDTVNCGPGRDTATVDSGDRVSNCEQVRRLQL